MAPFGACALLTSGNPHRKGPANDCKADSSCRSDDDWSWRHRRSADDYAGRRNAGHSRHPGPAGYACNTGGSLNRRVRYSSDTRDCRRSCNAR